MRSTSFYFISGVPPLGQNNPSEIFTLIPIIGMFSMKSAAKNEQLPDRIQFNTRMSKNPTWFTT